jgi:hypothetical protein
LGHATIAITLDTYSHAIPALQEEAAARIAQLVFAATQRPVCRPMSATDVGIRP